ncbi:MAG: element excision factor XisI family protein [Nostoc sp. ChiSLP02]|nr:element excision factor XisI family protein [Nostoc sp. DedSLP05]MDZ8098679.1 element excision factor XisI family protein [Nostoc sp. DedSLP01]MDZ8183708.1 element excision factor XisI family protein [Nostoc sp. ChiSLP02]
MVLDERNTNVESQLVFDTEHDHYQLIDIGWKKMARIYNCFIHIDIKDSKIWIQHNMTDVDLAVINQVNNFSRTVRT